MSQSAEEFRDLIATSPAAEPVASAIWGTPDKVLLHRGSSEIVLAVNIAALLTQAVRSDCLIELTVPQVDFVAADEPLFRLYGGAGAVDDDTLRRHRWGLRLRAPGWSRTLRLRFDSGQVAQ